MWKLTNHFWKVKLNAGILSKGFTPWSSTVPTEWLTVPPDLQLSKLEPNVLEKFFFFKYCELVEQFRQDHKVIWIINNIWEKSIKFDKTQMYHPTGLKLLTCLQLGLIHLNYHKFHQNFTDCINRLCMCSVSFENDVQSFLHGHHS